MTQRTLPTAARRFGAALLFLAAGGLFMGGLGRSALAEGPEAAPEAPAAEMPEALGDLEKLENALKSKKSINDEIIQYVDLVGGHFRAIKGPEPAADDAPQEAKDEYAAAKKKFDKDFADYRKKAEKAIFKALGLVKLRVLLGDGAGGFTPGLTLTAAGPLGGAAAGDLDGDGDLDIVLAVRDLGSVHVIEASGGTLTQHSTLPVGGDLRGVDLADFDGDGALDIAIAAPAEGAVKLLISDP